MTFYVGRPPEEAQAKLDQLQDQIHPITACRCCTATGATCPTTTWMARSLNPSIRRSSGSGETYWTCPASSTGHDLPVDGDVVVIGGGIIGISTAYELALSGKRVAVFEKGTLAGEQSSRNWGALYKLKHAFPVFANAELVDAWAGFIDVTPDAIPVNSAVDKIPGFFLASGFSGHGFGIGPAAGLLMAQLVQGHPPCVDPMPFRFDRFQR